MRYITDEKNEPGSQSYQQSAELRHLLLPGTRISHSSWREIERLIKLHDPTASWRQEPASDRQRAFLQRHGQWTPGLTKGDASKIIGDILARRPSS